MWYIGPDLDEHLFNWTGKFYVAPARLTHHLREIQNHLLVDLTDHAVPLPVTACIQDVYLCREQAKRAAVKSALEWGWKNV